jgi:hypothetical protein
MRPRASQKHLTTQRSLIEEPLGNSEIRLYDINEKNHIARGKTGQTIWKRYTSQKIFLKQRLSRIELSIFPICKKDQALS